jgi:hypothetical protein
MAAAIITVALDRTRSIAWSNLAEYRLGSLAQPPLFNDLRNARKSYWAMVAFLWAMLADRPEDFPTPETLAPHVNPDKPVDYVRAIAAAIKERVDEKNAPGSTSKRSRSSSSG